MQNEDKPIPAAPKRVTWNKGKLIGAKPRPAGRGRLSKDLRQKAR